MRLKESKVEEEEEEPIVRPRGMINKPSRKKSPSAEVETPPRRKP